MEGHGFVKDVDHLHQRKAGGMVAPLRLGELLFDFLPIGLGGRHRMIAVCDRKAGARQPRKGVQHVDGEILGDEIPRKMSAVLHEVEVIELFELLPFERAHELVLLVPVKDHRVRELDERASPYRHTSGQAGGNDLLRRTDERRGALLVGIFLEVDAGEKALADARVRRTFDEHEPARRLVHPSLFERKAHIAVDGLDALFVVLAEVGLGQDHMKCRGRVAHFPCDALPIPPVGGKLIAGDDRPFAKSLGGQKHPRDPETIFHEPIR